MNRWVIERLLSPFYRLGDEDLVEQVIDVGPDAQDLDIVVNYPSLIQEAPASLEVLNYVRWYPHIRLALLAR